MRRGVSRARPALTVVAIAARDVSARSGAGVSTPLAVPLEERVDKLQQDALFRSWQAADSVDPAGDFSVARWRRLSWGILTEDLARGNTQSAGELDELLDGEATNAALDPRDVCVTHAEDLGKLGLRQLSSFTDGAQPLADLLLRDEDFLRWSRQGHSYTGEYPASSNFSLDTLTNQHYKV